MHHISNLLEAYISDKDSVNCRYHLLYLKGLINDLDVVDITCPDDVSCVRDTFESLLSEMGIPQKYGFEEINKDLLVSLAIDEYRNGSFDSACEFLYYKQYVSDELKFPYEIIYSSETDCYSIGGMTPEESETVAQSFLDRSI